MMTEWYEKSINLLQLNGKCERTQEAYTRAVRMLIDFYDKTPDSITEEELQAYFLHRKNVDHWSPNTMRIGYCGIHFFFVHGLKRTWHLFNLLRAQTEKRLPAVLSREEIRQIPTPVHTSHNPAFLTTVYSCGLRLQEALHLEVSDIDSHRLVIPVHHGKGAKDRFVPLPQATLKLLRTHWRAHRHPRLLFLALGREGQSAHTTQTPMAKSSVEARVPKSQVGSRYPQTPGVHPYASPLLYHPSAGGRG